MLKLEFIATIYFSQIWLIYFEVLINKIESSRDMNSPILYYEMSILLYLRIIIAQLIKNNFFLLKMTEKLICCMKIYHNEFLISLRSVGLAIPLHRDLVRILNRNARPKLPKITKMA